MSECLVKAAHIVLATRLSALGSAAPKASTRDKTNRWFNLETEEVESATPALERWKRDASSPLVMEIFGRKLQQADGASSSSGGSSVLDPGNLLEVWTLQIGRKKPQGGAFGTAPSDHSTSSSATSSGSNSSQQARLTRVNSSRMDIPLVYKRAVILLRSLFCFVRVLPCFSIFQVTKRSSTSKLSITSNMRTGPPKTQPPSFDGIPCRSHAFKPIETPLGSICISVSYATAPVEALTRELGSGIVGDARRSAAGIGVGSAAGAGAGACSPSASSRGASPHATTPAGIPVPSGGATHAHASPAAYSAPQVVRRKSWSYSRNQIQQQEASRRFTDVMVFLSLRRGWGPHAQEQLADVDPERIWAACHADVEHEQQLQRKQQQQLFPRALEGAQDDNLLSGGPLGWAWARCQGPRLRLAQGVRGWLCGRAPDVWRSPPAKCGKHSQAAHIRARHVLPWKRQHVQEPPPPPRERWELEHSVCGGERGDDNEQLQVCALLQPPTSLCVHAALEFGFVNVIRLSDVAHEQRGGVPVDPPGAAVQHVAQGLV